MHRLMVGILALGLAVPAGAQCQGDFNGDNMVVVNELIIAVNNALNGCMTGACPIDFADDNSQRGTTDCYYTGRWNESCGASDLEARFISDTQFVIVDFQGFTPGLFFGAEVTSPTTANLVGWFQQPDGSDLTDSAGTLTLTSGGGGLVVEPTHSPFMIEGCDFVRFAGALTDVVNPPAAARSAVPVAHAAAFSRLRAARAARPGRPDLQRGASAGGGSK